MSRPGFLDTNLKRAYPFILGTVNQSSGALTTLRLPDSSIVDCAFIVGPQVPWDPKVHKVYLKSVSRSGGSFTFSFACTALFNHEPYLTFTCPVTNTNYEYLAGDTGAAGLSISASASSSELPLGGWAPLWEGFMVAGDLTDLAALLPGDGVINGDAAKAVVEPTLVQSLFEHQVSGLTFFNADRLRHEPPEECPPLAWPYPIDIFYSQPKPAFGDVLISQGFNCEVIQSDAENSITFVPQVGGGLGEPCEELILFKDEIPPPGRNALDGSVLCGETLKSINGVNGPMLNFISSGGVKIVPRPDQHTIDFYVDLAGTSLNIPVSANSSS